jgi:hypothetical protein
MCKFCGKEINILDNGIIRMGDTYHENCPTSLSAAELRALSRRFPGVEQSVFVAICDKISYKKLDNIFIDYEWAIIYLEDGEYGIKGANFTEEMKNFIRDRIGYARGDGYSFDTICIIKSGHIVLMEDGAGFGQISS